MFENKPCSPLFFPRPTVTIHALSNWSKRWRATQTSNFTLRMRLSSISFMMSKASKAEPISLLSFSAFKVDLKVAMGSALSCEFKNGLVQNYHLRKSFRLALLWQFCSHTSTICINLIAHIASLNLCIDTCQCVMD